MYIDSCDLGEGTLISFQVDLDLVSLLNAEACVEMTSKHMCKASPTLRSQCCRRPYLGKALCKVERHTTPVLFRLPPTLATRALMLIQCEL